MMWSTKIECVPTYLYLYLLPVGNKLHGLAHPWTWELIVIDEHDGMDWILLDQVFSVRSVDSTSE